MCVCVCVGGGDKELSFYYPVVPTVWYIKQGWDRGKVIVPTIPHGYGEKRWVLNT